MASVNRIDSVYDVAAIKAEQEKVEAFVKASVQAIKDARAQSIGFNIDTKSFSDYAKNVKELEKVLSAMTKVSTDAVKASTLLAKQKEAEAKAMLATQKATVAATKETERQAAATKKAADAAEKLRGPYALLSAAFLAAAKRAKDLGAEYGTLDKRAQAAAKEANNLNNKLKAIDSSIGNHQRNVGNYSSALDGAAGKVKGLAFQLLALAGLGSFFSGAIDEFVEMDKNVRILQNTLSNVGVPEAFDRISNKADELAKKFKFIDNDAILKSFNQLIVYGKLTEDQINQLIPVIIDFATAQGIDLQSTTSTVIKALEGNGKALKEYGIDIKDAKNTTEAFGIVMDQLAPKVEGVGEAFGETAAGGLAAARQGLKDLQESIGAKLLPLLVFFLDGVNKIITGLQYLGETARHVFDDVSDLFSGDFGVLFGKGESQLKRTAEQMERIEKLAAKGLAKVALEGRSAGEAINELNQRLVIQQTAAEKARKNLSGVFSTEDVKRYEKAVRVTRLALQELFNTGGKGVLGSGDPNKAFTTPGAKKATAKADTSAFDTLKANIELDKEFDLKRLENDKLSYAERLAALAAFGEDSERLIITQADHELQNADLTADQRVKIENDKNNALIRLAQDLGEKLAKVTIQNFKVDSTKLAESVKGLPKEIQKALDEADKAQKAFIAKRAEDIKQLKADITDALINLASEIHGFFFDVFTNAIERQKNEIQDQIDLLETQKQKDIEVANQTITNAQEKADAITVIEARAAAKRQQLELKQRQLDQRKAQFEKAQTIANIVQTTALAVVGALAQVKTLGPYAIALAAIIGALGAIQIARAAAAPIPRYAEGTEGHPGGPAVVGDGGRSEGVLLPDGSYYKTPATDTLVNLPRGSKVYKDYNQTIRPSFTAPDTTEELRQGFGQVVRAIKLIPQPIIRAERAWTQAHKTGSTFRNYINRSI